MAGWRDKEASLVGGGEEGGGSGGYGLVGEGGEGGSGLVGESEGEATWTGEPGEGGGSGWVEDGWRSAGLVEDEEGGQEAGAATWGVSGGGDEGFPSGGEVSAAGEEGCDPAGAGETSALGGDDGVSEVEEAATAVLEALVGGGRAAAVDFGSLVHASRLGLACGR